MFHCFSHPWFLLLLPLAPVLTWSWLRRRRNAILFPTIELAARLPGRKGMLARRGGAALRLLGLSLLVIALAGPRWPDWGTRIPTEGIAIALVVDVSGSMAEEDFTWDGAPISRMEAVKRLCRLFVEGGENSNGTVLAGRANDLICLVTFGTRPECPCPLTLSHSVLLRLLEAEQPRRVPTESETNIGDAIAWGLYKLESAGPCKKAIILVTDGEHNVLPPALKPKQAGQLAAGLGVPVYAINVAGEPRDNSPRNEFETKDAGAMAEQNLQSLARLTGGRYFRAEESLALLTACQDVDRLARHEIESFQYRRYHQAYAWFSLASLVFLLTAHLLESTVWRRVP
jgi:Ca-activated chloride channel family protein